MLHLLRRQILAEPRVHLVVAREQRLDRRHPLLDVAEHGLRRIEPRLLREKADRDAGGRKRLAEKVVSSPAMMRSSELLPAPFSPSTPILAPEENDSQMSSRTLVSGGWTFPSPFMV